MEKRESERGKKGMNGWREMGWEDNREGGRETLR